MIQKPVLLFPFESSLRALGQRWPIFYNSLTAGFAGLDEARFARSRIGSGHARDVLRLLPLLLVRRLVGGNEVVAEHVRELPAAREASAAASLVAAQVARPRPVHDAHRCYK